MTIPMHLRILLFIVAVPLFSQQNGEAEQDRYGCREVAAAVNRTLRDNLFDAAHTHTTEYRTIEQKVADLSERCADLSSFVSGFNALWNSGPFSHVRLIEARMSAEQTANYLDTMNVVRPGAMLSWNEDIAILTVYTMMGQNTITQIGEAYSVVKDRNARALIIDLRKNEGGAFAVRPLVGHLLSSELDAGIFLSRTWTEQHSGPPDENYIQSLQAWDGWSIRSFWKDVQEKGVLRIVFPPVAPRYAGPVYVLTSRKTASAAELAADVLRATGRTTLIGEKTAGKMLSQKMFDIPNGLLLALPIADYYSIRIGHIEGNGVNPDIVVEANRALEHALDIIRTTQDR